MAQMTFYDENFGPEREIIDTIRAAIGDNLPKIEEILGGMSSYWEDEKSVEFLPEAQAYISESKTAYTNLLSNVDSLYTQIKKWLSVYEKN